GLPRQPTNKGAMNSDQHERNAPFWYD
ncbi:MAG: hypothetical protein QOF31_5559, partial [Mycobacterium sp.]|nr:hypothetical protein [Mycobacterium sp.]